jgi:hypothetical protein
MSNKNIQNKSSENLNLEHNPKTIYRDKKGRVIDSSQTKEAKEKELEKLNQENVSKKYFKIN